MRRFVWPALLLPVAAALPACDTDDARAGVYVAYAAETSVPTDLYLDQRRVVDNAQPGDATDRLTSSAERTRFDLVPQRGEAVSMGRRLYFALPKDEDYVATVVGTTRFRVDAPASDTLGVVVYRRPSGDSVRVVNGSVRPVVVTVGLPTMPPAGPPRTALDGFGAASPSLFAPPGASVTVSTVAGVVLFSRPLTPGVHTVVVGNATSYAF